jgi:hypothetical protein
MSVSEKDNIIKVTDNSNKLTEDFIDNQKKQIENILSTISYNSNKFNSKVCSNLIDSSLFTLKIIKTIKENQNKIITTVKENSNKYIELQKNLINLFQSVAYFPFFNLSTSSLENFNIPKRYFKTYNTINKDVLDDTTNIANVANQVLLSGIQNIIKITELTQKYYNDIFQYYFGTQKTERSSNK